MNQISFIRLFVLLGCGLLIAAILGCSEKVVNESDLPGDGNLVIDLQLSPAETMALVDLYLLTVTAPDMDMVVDTLRLVEGHYVVGNVQVPIGERRLFVLEGLRGAALGLPQVIYRGQTVAPVRPGVITTLNIVLRPVVPMARLSPVYSEINPGEGLELEFRIYNIQELTYLQVDLYATSEAIRGGSVTLHESQNPGVSFNGGGEGSWVGFQIADTTGGTIVDAHGNGILASLSYQATTPVGAGLPPVSIVIEYIYGGKLDGDTVGASTIFLESADARLVPLAEREVQFPDPALEAEVRRQVGVQAPLPIMLSDVAGFMTFSFIDQSVDDLTGMENMINLYWLDMSHNPIQDISPLATLHQMTTLYAENDGIQTIAPLAGMTGMRTLDLDANWLTDLTPLAGMTVLNWVELRQNQITDISPLANKNRIGRLYLGENQISDITPLQGLTNLYYLDLHSNQISDILPLVNNPGLGSGDVVELWNNTALISDPIQQGHVATLRDRGVTVYMYQPGK